MIEILDLNFQGISKAIAAFVVKSSEGPILVETGPYSTYETLQNQLSIQGIEIENIKHVLITHIHLDHAGAAWALADRGAKIYLHPFGEGHMANPEKLWNSAKLIYGDKMEMLWGKMQAINKTQLVAVGDEEEFQIGDLKFKSWHTPGHANHHIAWQLDRNLFCGDVAGVKIIGGPVVPPCPPPDINLEKWKSSIDLIKGLGMQKLYLTHFGVVEDVDDHLDELWDTLKSWADWIKPRFDKGDPTEMIIPDFQLFTGKQLAEKGVDEYGLKQYETANPTWMSVAGLLRYWKKATQQIT